VKFESLALFASAIKWQKNESTDAKRRNASWLQEIIEQAKVIIIILGLPHASTRISIQSKYSRVAASTITRPVN